MTPANINRIPNFLKAKSPDKLRALMLRNNVSKGTEFKYFDISFSNGNWYAWFLEDITQQLLRREKV